MPCIRPATDAMSNLPQLDSPLAKLGCTSIATPGEGLENIYEHGAVTYAPHFEYFGKKDSQAEKAMDQRTSTLSAVTIIIQ